MSAIKPFVSLAAAVAGLLSLGTQAQAQTWNTLDPSLSPTVITGSAHGHLVD